MPRHPRDSIPKEQIRPAMEALLLTLARDEPESLLRAIQTLESANASTPGTNAAAVLAKEYLTLAGVSTSVAPANQRLFRFSYSGYVLFAVTAGSRRAAKRIAREHITALLATESPVGAVAGPYTGHEVLLDLTFWLADDGEGGQLELESVDE